MENLTNILGAILRFIYQSLINLGNEPEIISYYAIALMLMALLQKIITIPLTVKSAENSKRAMELQPEIDKIREKYKNDPETQNRKMMQYYEENDYTPGGGCGGCLTMLIPIIIIFAMLRVIRDPEAYIVAQEGVEIAKNFLWIPDLSQPDPYFFGLPLIYALSLLLYTYINQKTNPAMASQSSEMQRTNQMMMYIMPVMLFFMSKNWAGGILLYWTTSNIIEIIFRSISSVVVKKEVEEE